MVVDGQKRLTFHVQSHWSASVKFSISGFEVSPEMRLSDLRRIRYVDMNAFIQNVCSRSYYYYFSDRAMTVKNLSKLDAVYSSLLTKYFVKGWGDPLNIQKLVNIP